MLFNFFFYLNDASTNWQIGFQDPATPIMEGIIELHNIIFFYLIIIFSVVIYIIFKCLYLYTYDCFNLSEEQKLNNWINLGLLNIIKFHSIYLRSSKFNHQHLLEIIWTLIPCVFLILIGVPSFTLLYAMDEVINPTITLKVLGHQWYWSYEYSDYFTTLNNTAIEFDSYMLDVDDLEVGQLRLLTVDEPIVLPTNNHIRIIVSADDVLHSWCIPSLGIKIDAVPGRLNQVSLFLKRQGMFYGQCSEICGPNHGFMPIQLKAVDLDNYISWILNKYYAEVE